MLAWLLLVILTGTGAEAGKNGVIPVSAEGKLVAGGHDRCYVCATVSLEMKPVSFLKGKHPVISPSASSDHILDLKLGKVGLHAPNLVCVTSPWSQFAGPREGWSQVTQCYHVGKCGHPGMLHMPTSLTISPKARFDLYKGSEGRQAFLRLWRNNVPYVGRKKLPLTDAGNATFPRLVHRPCTWHPYGVCPHGCMDVCPPPGRNPEAFCLTRPRADANRHWQEESIAREDRLVLNRRSGTVSFSPSNQAVVTFAGPGDRFVSCAPRGVSGHCDVLSEKGVCLTRKQACDVSSVPPQLPILSTFVSHHRQRQFSGRHVQPLPDPLPYCMVTSRLDTPGSVAACVRALLSVSKPSASYRNQLETANHSRAEEVVLGSASHHVFRVSDESLRGWGTRRVGPFVLAQICVLTSIAVHFLLDPNGRNGER